jgi:hypothetical protein
MNPNEMNALEYAAYVRFALQLMAAGCFLLATTLLLSAIKDGKRD